MLLFSRFRGDSAAICRALCDFKWETDFYTPPVLRGAALFDNSAPAVYKKTLFSKDLEFYTPLALNRQKGQHLSALEVYKNESPS